METIPTTPRKKATPSKPAFVVNADGYTRLHITPLDPELFNVVVPTAARPLARNVSYHSIEAFPERRYGFVDLPQPDAEKLKKKLHGAVLKGVKMRVEPARPESLPEPTGDVPADLPRAKKPKKEKKDKKRKRDEEVVEGVAIHDRKIKRGWTVTEGDMIKEKRKDKERKSKDKKEKKDKKDKDGRKVKSKYTDGPECLFKQKLPEVPGTKDAAETTDAPKRKKRKGDREVVIHEFSKTNKVPTFLKSTVEASATEPLTFEDGKGWVNAEGDVVEPMKITRPATPVKTKPAKKKKKRSPEPEPEPESAHDDDDDTSSSGSSSESEPEAETAPSKPKLVMKAKATQKTSKPASAPADDDDTSSSGISSGSESESEGETSTDEAPRPTTPPKKLTVDTAATSSPSLSTAQLESSRPKSSASVTSLTIKIPPVTPAKVHPLEALYKRPAGATGEAAPAEPQPFSFFGNDDIEDDGEEGEAAEADGPALPMTPFSKQDLEFRNTRSAAPTPDTAHPSRLANFWPIQDEMPEEDEEDAEDLEDEEGDTTMANTAANSSKEETSDFQKAFWENRGDLNRSWKKRRKLAHKEKRNRENRARAARAI